jgi:hypothetical protein
MNKVTKNGNVYNILKPAICKKSNGNELPPTHRIASNIAPTKLTLRGIIISRELASLFEIILLQEGLPTIP